MKIALSPVVPFDRTSLLTRPVLQTLACPSCREPCAVARGRAAALPTCFALLG
jgi:hypothetical protein